MRRRAFSLVEVLVALTILMVLGGALATFLVRAFQLWSYGIGRTRELVPLESVALALERDFAAAAGGLGFTGTEARCSFTTLVPVPQGAVRLVAAEYTFSSGSAVRDYRESQLAAGSRERYAPLPALRLRYGAGNLPPEEWLTEWESATNSPTRLLLESRDGKLCRLLLRRTP